MLQLQLELGLNNILSYKRLAYTYWHALAELVDNSTQSFFDNRADLTRQYEAEGSQLTVRMILERQAKRLRITDNAMGMDLEELTRAATIGAVPPNTDGRSSYGMGLKTASCWMGDLIKVTTSKLGVPSEFEITLDVNRVAAGDPDLGLVERECSSDEHYTIIEISELHHPPATRTVTKIKSFLQSMYRVDLHEGLLLLEWNHELLRWTGLGDLRKAADGTPYRREFEFDIDGRAVRGWVGILDKGSRAKAGFSVLRAGRVIHGSPESWRPPILFGDQEGGRNDLANQRLVGEIHFDGFDVSHTKDRILWTDDELNAVDDELGKLFADYREEANTPRRGSGSHHSPAQVDAAAAQIREVLESPEMVDRLTVEDIPAPEIAEAALAETARVALSESPNIEAVLEGRFGDTHVALFCSYSNSANDSFMAFDVPNEASVQVIVNMNHPFLEFVPAGDGLSSYLSMCIYDALAEWRASWRTQAFAPDTVRVLKDALLRVPMSILRREARERSDNNGADDS